MFLSHQHMNGNDHQVEDSGGKVMTWCVPFELGSRTFFLDPGLHFHLGISTHRQPWPQNPRWQTRKLHFWHRVSLHQSSTQLLLSNFKPWTRIAFVCWKSDIMLWCGVAPSSNFRGKWNAPTLPRILASKHKLCCSYCCCMCCHGGHNNCSKRRSPNSLHLSCICAVFFFCYEFSHSISE